MKPFKIKSKVARLGKIRRIVEIPKAVRHNFKPKEEVYIEKIKTNGGKQNGNKK